MTAEMCAALDAIAGIKTFDWRWFGGSITLYL